MLTSYARILARFSLPIPMMRRIAAGKTGIQRAIRAKATSPPNLVHRLVDEVLLEKARGGGA
jgi:hypothetical protein